MITVGELAHFIYHAAQIIRMNFERQPQRLKPVEDACQLIKPVVRNVARKIFVKIFVGSFQRVNRRRVLNQER